MQPGSQDLQQHISDLSDEQLTEMLTINSGQYREDALNYARVEAAARGLVIPLPVTESKEPEEAEAAPIDTNATRVCPTCGGELRRGTLVAEKELTIIFDDNKEERFVRVTACNQCGRVSMIVDFETAVQT